MTAVIKNIVPKYFSTHEAARYLALSPRTLEKYRRTGEGPIFYKFGGKVVYALEEINAWAEKCAASSIRETRQRKAKTVVTRS